MTVESSYTSNTRVLTSSMSWVKSPGCHVFPTPPGNRQSPVNNWVTPPVAGPFRASAIDPGVCPRRWMTSNVSSPICTVSPLASKRSGLTGSGSESISLAAVGAPVAAATASSACQWSKCWWLVTISDTLGAFCRIRSISASASLAASISSVSPVAEQVTRYALLSMGPTETFRIVAPGRVRRAAVPGWACRWSTGRCSNSAARSKC